MIIDFHTHICPDKVAKKMAEKVKEALGDAMPFCGPMTYSGLLNYMEKCAIDKAVTFCVADREKTVRPANDFVITVSDNQKIIGFGTIVPDMKDAVGEVKRIKKEGIKGIKFHSLFQDITPFNERLYPIFEEMGEDIIALFHSGVDPGHPDNTPKMTPKGIRKIKELFPKLKIVAAHFGGLGMLEESEEWVIGRDIYIDTSWSFGINSLDPNMITRILRKHGVEKVLFATDYPTTASPKEQIQWTLELSLTDEEKEMIFWRNSMKLLDL